MFQCPWSTNQLKSLSRHIRDETQPPASLPAYRDVMLWYDDVAAQVGKDLQSLDWGNLLEGRTPLITSRAKTIDTLRQKLHRDPGTPLPSVQDVAGVRFEAEMSLDEQDAVAGAIRGFYDQDERCVKDLRAAPHSGYRAVHLWLRLPVRVEVQIRTHMQGEWANVYEAAADIFGREIRYGVLPEVPAVRDAVLMLQGISTDFIARAENERNQLSKNFLVAAEAKGMPYASDLQAALDKTWNDYLEQEVLMRDSMRIVLRQLLSARGKG